MMGDLRRDFDQISMGTHPFPTIGKIKFAEAGIGFKEFQTGKVTTVPAAEIKKFQWVRASRDFQLRITKGDKTILKFDGFERDAFENLTSTIKAFYQKPLEQLDYSLRGWNWGTSEFQGTNLSFIVGNKPSFEVPLTHVANTTLPSKNEVAMEFVVPNTTAEGKKVKDDMLVEMRFYVPGMATVGQVGEGVGGRKQLKDAGEEDKEKKKKLNSDGEEVDMEDGEIDAETEEPVLGEDGEAMSRAALFYDTIKQRADVGAVQGEAIVTFQGMLCLTPRGRFEVELHADFFRLRGKSHDYKVNYQSIVKLILLPKPDDLHYSFVIGLEPPLRQGQTRYPFLVFQFEKEEEVELELNLDEETLKTTYEGRLQKSYDAPSFEVVGEVFKGLANKKLITAGSYKTSQNHAGFKCSYKANEAFLFPLEKSFLSIPKPPIYIPLSQITSVSFARVSGAASTTKFFEVKFNMESGQQYAFGNIPREEYASLEQFCKAKKLRVMNEMADEGPAYDLGSEVSDASAESEEEAVVRKRSRSDGEEEESSEDEDFIAKDSGSDVAEEFNSDYSSSSDSDEDGNGSGQDDNQKEERKSKEKKERKDSSEKKPRKKRSKADPEKERGPKKAMSAFMYFSKAKRPEVVANNPGLAVTEQAKLLGQMWKETSSEDREEFEKQAQLDKERYQREVEAGVTRPAASSSKPSKPSKPSTTSASTSKKADTFKSAEFVDSDDD